MTSPRFLSTILLLLQVLLCLGLSHVVKAQTKDEIGELVFVNFGTEPVMLYWHNNDTGDLVDMGTVEAYQIKHMNTVRGHQWSFKWGPTGNRVSFKAKKKRDLKVIPSIPHQVNVKCTTTKGDLRITVRPSWAPLGAARFLELVSNGYYNGVALHRVVPGFLTQFGIGADAEQRTNYRHATIPDDAAKGIPFQEGYLAFAGSGPHSRTTELFVVMPNTPAKQLESFGTTNPWETPFGFVHPRDVQGVVAHWYSGYGDMPPWGQGPDPQQIHDQGYEPYLNKEFPNLDSIETCRIVEEDFGSGHDEL